jgi:DNA-binding transcriptional LysR family regulator
LQHARAILRQAERLREDLGAYAGGLAGQIRLLSNTNALTEFLPEALSSFLLKHPQVSVDL